MNICIYLRKSRAEENMTIQEVLDRHRKTLIKYARENHHNIIEVKEEIVSGESITRRPQMISLLNEIEDNKYDAILVMDIDRLGRGNMREQGLILETFKDSNTLILTPRKTYNLNNEFDEEFSEFEAFMARRELKIIKKRLMRGRMKSLEEGNYICPHPPYGYDKEDKTLVVNDEEAKIVRLIYDLYINKDMGDSKIANHLNSISVRTKQLLSKWDKSTVRKILTNPIYTGKVSWNKKKYDYNMDGNRISKVVPLSDWLIYEGKHTAIISDDVFKKANRVAKSRYIPKTHRNRGLVNPLASIVKCGNCGSTMTLRTCKNKKPTLRCYKNCGTKSSYLYIVEEEILSDISNELNDLGYIYERDNSTHLSGNHSKLLSSRLSSLEREQSQLNYRLEKIYTFLEDGVYSLDVFKERKLAIDQRIKENISSICTIKQELVNLDTPINYMFKEGMTFDEIYGLLNAEEKNRVLRSVISKVEYNKSSNTNMNIVVYFRR